MNQKVLFEQLKAINHNYTRRMCRSRRRLSGVQLVALFPPSSSSSLQRPSHALCHQRHFFSAGNVFVIRQYHRNATRQLLPPVSRFGDLVGAATKHRQQRHMLSSQQVSGETSASANTKNTTTTTHFGFEEVAVDDKEGRVREVFDKVADSYDIMNDLMSGGLHRMWKDHLLEVSAVESMAASVRRRSGHDDGELRVLDVAGGTGDVAFRFVDAANCMERSRSSGTDPVSVTVCDINFEMLRVGERRARERYGNQLLDDSRALSFVQGNAQSLDKFRDDSFDLYTIAFGLRNVTDVDAALREAHRVLKPGGRFMCLEFSRVPNYLFRTIYDAYSFNVIPIMGHVVANDRASYQYLVESIRRFSDQEELVSRMDRAGFQHTRYTNLTGGIVALHEGWKPFQ